MVLKKCGYLSVAQKWTALNSMSQLVRMFGKCASKRTFETNLDFKLGFETNENGLLNWHSPLHFTIKEGLHQQYEI